MCPTLRVLAHPLNDCIVTRVQTLNQLLLLLLLLSILSQGRGGTKGIACTRCSPNIHTYIQYISLYIQHTYRNTNTEHIYTYNIHTIDKYKIELHIQHTYNNTIKLYDKIFVRIKISGPVRILYLQSGPVHLVWSKKIHNCYLSRCIFTEAINFLVDPYY